MISPLIIFPIMLLVGLYLGEIRWGQVGVFVYLLVGAFFLCFAFKWVLLFFVAVALLDRATLNDLQRRYRDPTRGRMRASFRSRKR